MPETVSATVFIDLSELVAGLRERSTGQAPDWEAFLRGLIVAAASTLSLPAETLRFAGGFVYIPAGMEDRDVEGRQATAGLAASPGIRIVRVKGEEGPGECVACDLARSSRCHRCRNTTAAGSGAFGGAIAEAMATDLFRLAREEALDVPVLVSADRGLAPVVRLLQDRGKRVVHATLSARGREISDAASGVIDLSAALA